MIQKQKPKIDKTNNDNVNNTSVSEFENNAYIFIGPRNVGKTFYMLTKIEKIGNKRPIHLITRSPNQYPNYKTRNKIKAKAKYNGSIVLIDNMNEKLFSNR